MESFPKKTESKPRTPGRWRRRLLWGTATAVVLGLLGWAIVTSNWFLRVALLPRVNHALNATVNFENAQWKPGSQLQLQNITLHATGKRPLFKAARLEVKYRWRDLLAGRMVFGEIVCEEPTLFLHIDRNGNPNYAPLLERPKSGSKGEPVWIGKLFIKDAQVEYRRDHQSGTTETAKLHGFTLSTGKIAAGQSGQITVQGRADYTLKPLQQSSQGLAGDFQLKFKHQLDDRLLPTRVESKGSLRVATASGQFAFAAGLEAELDGEATAEELRKFALQFTHAGNALGKLEASGTLQPGTGGADLTVALHRVDQRVLNFLGRPIGFDFHSTVLHSTNRVRVAGFGKTLAVSGTMHAQPFQLSTSGTLSPPLEQCAARYAFEANLPESTARMATLEIRATHEGRPLLVGQLDQPMQFDWSTRDAPVGESVFSLTAENLDLSDWHSWLGQTVVEGRVSAGVKIHFQEAGRSIGFALAAEGAGLRLSESDPRVLPASLRATGAVRDFRQLSIAEYSLRLGSTNAPVLAATGDGVQCDLHERIVHGQAIVKANLARVRPWFYKTPVTLGGMLDYNGTVSIGLRTPHFQAAKGQLHLADVAFRNGGRGMTNLHSRANIDVRLDESHRLTIHALGARVSGQGREFAPHFTAVGKWDLQSGVVDFSQVTVRDFQLRHFAAQTGLTGFTNGLLAATVSVQHSPGRQTRVNGTAAFTDARQPGWAAPVTTTASGQLTVDESPAARWPVSLEGMRVEFPRGNVLDGEFQVSGGWHPQTGAAAFIVEGAELDHRLFAPWLALNEAAFRWTAGKLKWPGKTRVDFDGMGGGSWRGLVHASGVRAEARDFNWPDVPMNAELFLDFSRTKSKEGQPVNTVRDANLKVMLPDKTIARLRCSARQQSGNRWRMVFQPPAEKEKGFISHQLMQPLLGKHLAPRKLTQGILQHPGRVEVSSDGAGGFQVKGDVEFARVRMADPTAQWPDKVLSATATLDLARRPVPGTREWRIVSNGTRGFIFINNKHSGTFSVNGDFNPVRQQGDLEWDCRELDELVLAPLSTLLGGPALRTVRVKMLKGSVRLNETGGGHVETILQADRVRLMDDPESALPRALILNLKGGVTNHVYHLNQCFATFTATNSVNRQSSFNVTGSLDLSRRGALSGHLMVAAKSLDATAMQTTISQFRYPKALASPAAPTSPPTVFRNFRWDLDVKELRWFGLTATNVLGTIVMDGREVHFKPLEMKLFGAPVMAEGWYVPQGNRTRYAMNFSCEQLPLNQLNDYFEIKRKHNYGLLSTRFHVAANALNGPEFQKSFLLRGIEDEPAYLTTTQARWALFRDGKMPKPNVIPSAVSSIFDLIPGLSLPMDGLSGALGSIALTLRDKELEASHLGQGHLMILIENGIISHDFTVAGPLVRANIQGNFKLANHWEKSVINEKLAIEFAPDLANKYSPTAIVLPKKKFVKIPPCLSITGPLDNVTFKKNDVGLALMLGGQLTGAPGRLFRKLPIPLLNKEEDMLVNPIGILRWLIPGGDED